MGWGVGCAIYIYRLSLSLYIYILLPQNHFDRIWTFHTIDLIDHKTEEYLWESHILSKYFRMIIYIYQWDHLKGKDDKFAHPVPARRALHREWSHHPSVFAAATLSGFQASPRWTSPKRWEKLEGWVQRTHHCDVNVDDGWNETTFPNGRFCQVCQDIWSSSLHFLWTNNMKITCF